MKKINKSYEEIKEMINYYLKQIDELRDPFLRVMFRNNIPEGLDELIILDFMGKINIIDLHKEIIKDIKNNLYEFGVTGIE